MDNDKKQLHRQNMQTQKDSRWECNQEPYDCEETVLNTTPLYSFISYVMQNGKVIHLVQIFLL